MAFRRRKDTWSDFLHQHRDDLRAWGVPEEVSRDRLGVFVFLDHGFDQWGWAKNPNAFFNSDLLFAEQIARLADFVASHFGETYRVRIASRWLRDRERTSGPAP